MQCKQQFVDKSKMRPDELKRVKARMPLRYGTNA
jgi:hypothetical protein